METHETQRDYWKLMRSMGTHYTDSCTDRKTNRQAGGQEVRQIHTQTRVPINLLIDDGND